MATTKTDICNRALTKLGAKRISDLTDDSRNARSCNSAYDSLREAELRAHPWAFAIARSSLAADATAPSFGRANSFTLPSDFLRLLSPYPEDNTNDLDHLIEGNKILSDDDAPLNIRYIKNEEDVAKFDSLFKEALAAKIALELCEEITQSNTKKDLLTRDYDTAINEARRINAIERPAQDPPEDTWITARR